MALPEGGIISIIRDVRADQVIPIVSVLVQNGIAGVEVSLSNEEEGLNCIRNLRAHFGDSLYLGVGTVIEPRQVELALEAGARFIITPGWDRELVRLVIGRGIEVFPGVFTPGDVMQAVQEGVEIMKVFPAGSLGPDYIRSLRGPFPGASFMAVGGVNLQNINEFYKAGCRFFAIGNDLVPRQATAEQLEAIGARAAAYSQSLKETS
ncbi:2-dehydro-3-deoxy-6-phosphogalactonate aldolase [compost metagenome]